jgi:hypothetical protein
VITGYVVGETEVGVRLDLLEGKARFELSAGIGKLAAKLNARVQRDKLSGQVLGGSGPAACAGRSRIS